MDAQWKGAIKCGFAQKGGFHFENLPPIRIYTPQH